MTQMSKNDMVMLRIQIVAICILIFLLISGHIYLMYHYYFIKEEITDFIVSLYYSFIIAALIQPFIYELFCYTKRKIIKRKENEDSKSLVNSSLEILVKQFTLQSEQQRGKSGFLLNFWASRNHKYDPYHFYPFQKYYQILLVGYTSSFPIDFFTFPNACVMLAGMVKLWKSLGKSLSLT